ncbi:MAG: VWA domain-containing protein [Thermoplasmata archaeon]|nr:MAG: VWA domain-containing protein [Thermoplasmata archaeon]
MASIFPILIPESLPSASGTIIRSIFFDDMEAGGPAALGQWRTQDALLVRPSQPSASQWELGTPTPPPNAYSPTICWGTELGGAYYSPSEYLLITPTIDLTTEAILSAQLSFWHTYSFFQNDGGWVEVNPMGFMVGDIIHPEGGYPGHVFSPLGMGGSGYNGSNSGWEQAIFDLSEYIGQTIRIGFRFCGYSGDMISRGWYIDDVSVDNEWFDGPKIGPDQTKAGFGGDTLSYTLTVTNYNIVDDYIDTHYTDTNNWQVRILNATTLLPLQDKGGTLGLPDVYLSPMESENIIVQVTIPATIDDWDISDTTIIYAISFDNPMNQDTAELITKTPWPDVGISKIALPSIKKVGDTINIIVTVKNYGDWTTSFNVEGLLSAMLITPPSTQEPTLQYISNLKPNETIDLQWSFIPTVSCEYTFSATTLLDIDQFVYNNKSVKSILVQEMLWMDDMESGGDAANGLWTHFIDSGSSSTTDWELGVPTWLSGPSPSSVPSLPNCWGTDLSYAYAEDTDCYLFTPASSAFDFRGFDEIVLAFSHWWSLQSTTTHGEDVGMIVYTFDADPISTMYITGIEFNTNSNDWEREEIDMTPFVKDEPYVRFGWRLFEDIGGNKFEHGIWPGWYMDDVAVWAKPARPEIIITELMDSGGNEYLEVFNCGSQPAILSEYGITLDMGSTWLSSGTWGAPFLSPNGHTYYNIPAGLDDLDNQGETISIVNRSIIEGLITDQISYGQKGTVPDPLPGESAARYWDGSKYKNEWARDSSPTIGFQNDGQGEVDFKYVVLNEVLYNPGIIEAFIELRYVGYPGNEPDIDVSDWILVVGDSVFTIPASPFSTILNLKNPFYVVNEGMFPGLFGTTDVDGDNIYLYTDSGLFVDEVGWNLPHAPDTSISRVPDGFGVKLGFKQHGLMGYDDPSSIAAGWQFGRTPSMSIVAIEADQNGVGDAEWTVIYDLNVTNHQDVADYIDLIFTPPSPGWIIEFYAADNVTLLLDNDGDGVIDTGLLPANSIMWIKVKITLPAEHIGDFEKTVITARSSQNLNGWDTVTLITETYPHIEVNKSSSRNEIWLNGTGMFPQSTTIELEIRGSGLAQSITFPQDVVFCIDSSGSMAQNDPKDLRKDAAKSYVDDMRIPDRGAVVDFDDNAILVGNDHLDSNYVQIKNNIDKIDSVGGTAIGAALKLANDELIANGDPTHIWIIILITDGLTGDEALCYAEADRAAENNIKIYTIGLGNMVDEDLLTDIAEITGGKYYPAPTPEYLAGIYYDIRTQTLNIAGKDLVAGDNVYFVRDVLPPWIDLIPGTFNVVPDNITVDTNGYTIMEWEVERVFIGDTLTYSFEVVSNLPGLVQTNFVSGSRVRYVKWTGSEVEELFPEVLVNVLLGPAMPPRLSARAQGDDVQLYWIPPQTTGIHHYLIYKSPTQTGFDFSDVWVNTLQLDDNGIIPTRTTWNITNATRGLYPKEEYYIIRAVNQIGEKSVTSNTAGKWTKTFYQGVNTFSLPLEPSEIKTTEWYTNNIPNCKYIKWMDETTHTWIKHDLGEGLGIDDSEIVVGKGYEISVASNSVYTFCGYPGAHIRYTEEELPAPSNFAVNVINDFGDVELTWDPVPDADHYIIYKSGTRNGLNDLTLFPLWETTYGDPMDTSFIDYNAAYFAGTSYYYFVVAVDDPSVHVGFNSSYSVGVWTAKCLVEYDTLALPLKLSNCKTADWYCDDIENVVGINYYIHGEQRWSWHSTRMPAGVYDPDIVMAEGYQISTIGNAKYNFIGI